jgi:hypothetical protein
MLTRVQLYMCFVLVCTHNAVHKESAASRDNTGKYNLQNMRCLDDYATPRLATVTLRPAPSDTVTIRPTNVFILRQSDPTGVRQSDHTQTAQFDPLEVGLNVGCVNPTQVQSDPFSALPGGLGDSSGDDTQMALLKNGAVPPERTSPTHGSAGRKLDLT